MCEYAICQMNSFISIFKYIFFISIFQWIFFISIFQYFLYSCGIIYSYLSFISDNRIFRITGKFIHAVYIWRCHCYGIYFVRLPERLCVRVMNICGGSVWKTLKLISWHAIPGIFRPRIPCIRDHSHPLDVGYNYNLAMHLTHASFRKLDSSTGDAI